MLRTRATRLWPLAMLPLLAGLFAMHGVQAANGAGHAVPMAASVHVMPHVPASHARHEPASHAMVEPASDAMLGPATHVGAGHDGTMCLALLALTLLVLAMTRAPWLAHVCDVLRFVRIPCAEYRRPPRGPPVHLRLCVFRL